MTEHHFVVVFNGCCKTWKRKPDKYKLPVKHGLRLCFYITPDNEKEWFITDKDYKEVKRKALCVKLDVSFAIPDEVLHDLAIEKGLNPCL